MNECLFVLAAAEYKYWPLPVAFSVYSRKMWKQIGQNPKWDWGKERRKRDTRRESGEGREEGKKKKERGKEGRERKIQGREELNRKFGIYGCSAHYFLYGSYTLRAWNSPRPSYSLPLLWLSEKNVTVLISCPLLWEKIEKNQLIMGFWKFMLLGAWGKTGIA